MFFSMAVSLFLGLLLFGSYFSRGWIPTFAAFLTVQVFVIFYGVSPAKLTTIVLAGTLVTFPVCNILLHAIVIPLHLPMFVSVSAGVFIVLPLCTELFRFLPWMTKKDAAEKTFAPAAITSPNKFFVNRVLGDIGELAIWGSSLTTIGVFAGTIVVWALNPMHPAYGTGQAPLILCSQLATAGAAVFVWYPRWKRNGWAFTFPSVLFTGAIFCTYPNHWLIVIPTIAIAVIVVPPLSEWLLRVVRCSGRWHPMTLVQLAIFAPCCAWSLVIMYIIMPKLQ
jgi:hypothetical protein